jgi:hypothetical protein
MKTPSGAEFRSSDHRGFRAHWIVDEDYRIEDGLLKPIAKGRAVEIWPDLHRIIASEKMTAAWHSERVIVERYLPITRPELPTEFAKLSDGSEKTILQFARRYGLLGYWESFKRTLSIYKRFWFLSESAEEDAGKPDFNDFVHEGIHSGDPLSWVIQHAQTVKLVLDLNDALSDRAALRSKLEQLTVRQTTSDEYSAQLGEIEYRYANRGELYPSVARVGSARRDYRDDFEFARSLITVLLNENLEGVCRQLVLESDKQQPSRVVSVFEPDSLIDAIYWHLADAIAGGSIKRCLFCGKFFNATHQKRVYCPPLMGMTGEGQCAQNDRARRSRAKPSNQAKKGRSHGRQRQAAKKRR